MKPPILTQFWVACLLLLISVACQKDPTEPYSEPDYSVTTYAGGKTSGPLEGHKDSVYLDGPNNLAVDREGNLFVSDRNTHQVRMIRPDGMVVSVAGSTEGFADGQGSAARFNTTRGLAVDAGGNIYVADRNNHSIRRITPAGTVTTLAGNGTAGYADGTGAAAQFNNPLSVALDPSGNLYVTDSDNHRIRKISPMGAVSTIAGNGTAGYADGRGAEAQFDRPRGIAVDTKSNFLFVADRTYHRIRKIDLQ